MEYMTLMGADDVRAAGHTMKEAAASIAASVAQLEFTLQQFTVNMRELLAQKEAGE